MKLTSLALLTVAFCLSVQAKDGLLNKRQGMKPYANCKKLAKEDSHDLNNLEDKLSKMAKDVTQNKHQKYIVNPHEKTIEKLGEHAMQAIYETQAYKKNCGDSFPSKKVQKAKEHCAKIMMDSDLLTKYADKIPPYNMPFVTIAKQVATACQQI